MEKPMNIVNCFKDNSTINIAAASGELVEGSSQIVALDADGNLKCSELSEEDLEPVKGNNMIIFTTSRKIICKNFKECEE